MRLKSIFSYYSNMMSVYSNEFSDLFEQGNAIIYDTCPIVMIDNSGSTSGWVLENEVIFAQNILKRRNITECYMMFWDDTVNFPNGTNKTSVDTMHSIHKTSGGGTYVCRAWDKLPAEWLATSHDIYVITDGEIGDYVNDVSNHINKFFRDNKKLYIVTVENNSSNYMKDNVTAGNTIFTRVSEAKLSHMIKQFICFNRFHNDVANPFVNHSNPDVGPNMAAFRDRVFRVDKTHEFIAYVENLIEIIKNGTETMEDKNNAYLRLSYDIVATLHYLTKDKSHMAKRATIDIFCGLFVDVGMYKQIRALLLNEVDNVAKGTASTFQGYKNRREKVFEKAQIALYNDTKKAITNIPQNEYVSFIVGSSIGDIIVGDVDASVINSLTINDKTYNNSSIKMGNHSVPMFPRKVTMDHGEFDQCVRQWCRANYAKKYGMNPASDMIMYCFFSDMVRVCMSDVPESVKTSYREMARLSMDRKRFGTDKSEYEYLMNNPPAPVKGNPNYITSQMQYLLYRALKHGGFNDISEVVINNETTDVDDIDNPETGEVTAPTDEPVSGLTLTEATNPDLATTVKDILSEFPNTVYDSKIRPMTFWYAFIKVFGDNNLIEAQLPYCEEDMRINGVTPDNVVKFVKSKLKPVSYYERKAQPTEYNYNCYVTMKDTTNTGGFVVPPHRLSKTVVCAPRYVVSAEGYDMLKQNTINCPVCYKNITDSFVPVPNYNDYKAQFTGADNMEPVITDNVYDNRLVDRVIITEDEYTKDNDQTLIPMSVCNFNTIAYTVEAPYIQEAVNGRSVEVKTQDEFNRIVFNRYPFLKDLNMEGVCLAGGFCRSILLRQRVKDLDFFMYGDNHNVNFSRVLRDIMSRLKALNPKYKFLMMYKHLFNVFEVVVVSDPNDFFQDEYKLDNYKQYKFKSLHRFDQFTVIDPETGKIYRKKNRSKWTKPEVIAIDDARIENKDFSNYFEDGDITGIRMCYRLQFILTRNQGIENIFNNFDMYPCRVAWDGKTTLFTEKSAKAFKYMINIVNENNYSDLYNHRLGKYFSYGFNIVLPRLDMKKLSGQPKFKIEKLTFKINNINGYNIMVDHNSHIEDKLKSIEKLEKKSMKDGKMLYKSALFCSLVSLLRYVKINDVSYRFTNEVVVPNDDGFMNFREKDETVVFIDKIESRIPNHDWYKEMGTGYDPSTKNAHYNDSINTTVAPTVSVESKSKKSKNDLDQGLNW